MKTPSSVPLANTSLFGDFLSDRTARHGRHSFGSGFSSGPGAELMDLGIWVPAALICYEAVFAANRQRRHRPSAFF